MSRSQAKRGHTSHVPGESDSAPALGKSPNVHVGKERCNSNILEQLYVLSRERRSPCTEKLRSNFSVQGTEMGDKTRSTLLVPNLIPL
jgi:hypothetical protein